VTAISSWKKFGKRSPVISRIKEQLEETKAAGKHIRIHWIQVHRGITGNKRADGVESIASGMGGRAKSLFQPRTWKAYGGENPNRNPHCGTRRQDGSGDSNTFCSLIMAPTPGLPNANYIEERWPPSTASEGSDNTGTL
jgi:hypothetical protein